MSLKFTLSLQFLADMPGSRTSSERLPLIQLEFLTPFLRNVTLSDPVKCLYQGLLRLLLVLFHDFPGLLSSNHITLCSLIPPNCIQVSRWHHGADRGVYYLTYNEK